MSHLYGICQSFNTYDYRVFFATNVTMLIASCYLIFISHNPTVRYVDNPNNLLISLKCNNHVILPSISKNIWLISYIIVIFKIPPPTQKTTKCQWHRMPSFIIIIDRHHVTYTCNYPELFKSTFRFCIFRIKQQNFWTQ